MQQQIRQHMEIIWKIPQTVFSCRGSYGVGKGTLNGTPPRRRCAWAFSLVIYSESETDLQKHLVKWPFWGTVCIWCGSGDDLWEILGTKYLVPSTWYQRTSLNMSFKHIFQVKVKQHFLHEKGREQTLRRETWSTLLQITLRVFFMSPKHGNHKNKH